MRFTDDQQKAIDLSGNSLLVSAAAGSGKTAVLTERVVKKLTADNPVMLDRLMILTFTNAAADEMKSRINTRLRDRLLQTPDDSVIKAQLSLLPSAQISTIHSACLAILRENFEKLGLDPRFSVGDEARLALQKSDTLYEFIEQLYENTQTDADAKTVINALVRGRDDNSLFNLLDCGSAFLEGVPFCEQFIKNSIDADFECDALKILESELEHIISVYNYLINEAHEKAAEFLRDECDSIEAVYAQVQNGNFDAAYLCSQEVEFKRYPVCPKKAGADPDAWKEISSQRAQLKADFLEVTERFLYAPREQIQKDRQKELVVIKSYLNLCVRLNDILLKKRKDDRVVSFSDIEKYTLGLLVKSYDGKTFEKTELADDISKRYDEIIVDEYQDCNDVQDLIFKALSQDGKNIFTVGDVKQSIYRFRGAQPGLFLKKQKEYLPAENNPLSAPSKINLSCNFRSHPKILEFVNRVFYTVMTKEYGIDYSDSHQLVPSQLFEGTDASGIDITLLVTSDSEKLAKATRIEAEAQYVAKKIKDIIGNEIIYDAKAGKERAVEPRDIAILLRAPKSSGMLFERALHNEGLECQNNNPSEKYLDTPEVRDAIAFLQAIDNPYDDIPLITVMYSRTFGFDVNELGTIRGQNKGMLFYDAVKECAKTDAKCAGFVNMLSELRTLSLTLGVYDLINIMYEKSGMLIGAKDEKQRANLMLLCELAAAFEADRYRGLFAFINYLLKLSQNDEMLPSARLKATDNCVNLLSIHHSKGLEYPVVFLCNSTANIQKSPSDEILFDSDFGIGGFLRESDTHREFSGIVRNIIRHKTVHAELCESIRLLYVALTRAQSRLYITGCAAASETEKMINDCDMAKGLVSDSIIMKSPSFLKWIVYSIIDTQNANPLRAFAGLLPSAKGGCADVRVLSIDEVLNGAEDFAFEKEAKGNIDKEKIKSLITREPDGRYDIPAKLSVSEIKGFKLGTMVQNSDFKRPRFLQGGVTGADRGSATHKFLQFCNFEKIVDRNSFEDECKRLVDFEFITKNEGALTDGDKIIEFLTSDIMKNLMVSGNYYKEKRFMFTLSANELGIDGCDEKIIVQGVLDCYFLTPDGAVIVDYKTDRVQSEDELTERYRVQLDMYEKALFITEGIKTYKKYIYSFALSKFILV